MKTYPPELADLAAALWGGDGSAFEPLIDCLLENGLNGYAYHIWEIWHDNRTANLVSVFVEDFNPASRYHQNIEYTNKRMLVRLQYSKATRDRFSL